MKRTSGIVKAICRRLSWSLSVNQTTVCFTVEVYKGKVAFQPPKPVKQLVNESMYQNRAVTTSSDTVAVY